MSRTEISALLNRATNKDIVDGWTVDKVLKLDEKSRAWLLQYFLEATGSLSSHSQLKILNKDQHKEAWRSQKKRLRKVGQEVLVEPDFFDQVDTLNPETILIALESRR